MTITGFFETPLTFRYGKPDVPVIRSISEFIDVVMIRGYIRMELMPFLLYLWFRPSGICCLEKVC
jgi:hypothetical protein